MTDYIGPEDAGPTLDSFDPTAGGEGGPHDPWLPTSPGGSPTNPAGNIPCAPGLIKDPIRGCVKPGERAPGDLPCPSGQCKDVVTGNCRTPGKNEKMNETDVWERSTGGGRGYCKQRSGGGGGGGGGAAAGVGGPGAGSLSPAGTFQKNFDLFGDERKSVWDNLQKIIDGGTRFSPEVMANLDSQAKLGSVAQGQSGERAAINDSIARGMGRSSNRDIGLARRTADAAYSEGTRANRIAKVNADFNDRMMALNAQEKWLDDMQKYAATLDQTQASREASAAQIALGYARIAAERAMLTERIRADLQIAQQNNDLGWFNAIANQTSGA